MRPEEIYLGVLVAVGLTGLLGFLVGIWVGRWQARVRQEFKRRRNDSHHPDGQWKT